MSEPSAAAPVRERRFTWIRAATDRVPTAWFAGIATGAFLLATAAFGGLATAAEPPLARLKPGTTHVNDMRSLTIERAVLIDELPGSGTTPEEGERVLALVVGVENNWTEPVRASGLSGSSSVESSFAVSDLGKPASSARMDDATIGPTLQPGVPAQVVYTWAVDADAFTAGDLLAVTLSDMSLYTASFVSKGTSWQDPVPAATLTLTLRDVGAGVDEDADDEG